MFVIAKNPIYQAHRWFKNGDHPNDKCEMFIDDDGKPFQGEGHVIRYYRHPNVSGVGVCECGNTFHDHGFIDSNQCLSGTNLVCPGDWVLMNENGLYFAVSNEEFEDQFVITTVEGTDLKRDRELPDGGCRG